MAEQWFYSSGGMKTGPISTEELRKLVASGQLKPTDVVQRQGTQNWVAILSLDTLLPKPGAASQPPSTKPDVPGLPPHKAQMLLGLGIASFLVLVLGPVVWLLATNDLKEMKAGRMDPSGEGTTNTARILGMIATGWGAFCVVSCCGCNALSMLMSAGH